MEVLWADDEPETFPYERTIAEGLGWNITDVSNKEYALEMINKYKYDLIIVDLILAETKYDDEHGHVTANVGVQLIKDIRNPDRTGRTEQDVEILVITAVVSKNTKDDVVPLIYDNNNYWSKPELINRDRVRKLLSIITDKITKKIIYGNGK